MISLKGIFILKELCDLEEKLESGKDEYINQYMAKPSVDDNGDYQLTSWL